MTKRARLLAHETFGAASAPDATPRVSELPHHPNPVSPLPASEASAFAEAMAPTPSTPALPDEPGAANSSLPGSSDAFGDARRKEGNELMIMGVGVGAAGFAGAALLGAACPLCVVAAPALIGAGAIRRWQGRRRKPPKRDAVGLTDVHAEDPAAGGNPRIEPGS